MNTVADSRIFKTKRNLTDAGFNELQIKKFFEYEKEKDLISQYRMLKEQKNFCLKNCIKVSIRLTALTTCYIQ